MPKKKKLLESHNQRAGIPQTDIEMYKFLAREMINKIPTDKRTKVKNEIELAITNRLDGYYGEQCPDCYEYERFCVKMTTIAKKNGITDEESFWEGQEIGWKGRRYGKRQVR